MEGYMDTKIGRLIQNLSDKFKSQCLSKSLPLDDRNVLVSSRSILQQSPNEVAQTFNDIDEALLTVLIVLGSIGLLLLVALTVYCCLASSTRRIRLTSSNSSASRLSELDDSSVEDNKTKLAFNSKSRLRSSARGSDRKLAISAQLYHYEKQKRELLALEQGNQSGANPSDDVSPSEFDCHSGLDSPMLLPNGDLTSPGSVLNGDDRCVQLMSSPQRANAGFSEGDGDAEEFAVYEYPGLVTAVGQIEIDNPLFLKAAAADLAYSTEMTDSFRQKSTDEPLLKIADFEDTRFPFSSPTAQKQQQPQQSIPDLLTGSRSFLVNTASK